MKGMRKFPAEVQKLFVKAARFERWGAGRTILREGHPAKFFYILLDGELAVTVVDKASLAAAVTGKRRAALEKGIVAINGDTQVRVTMERERYNLVNNFTPATWNELTFVTSPL
jgi:hypothetical protein